MNNNIMIATTHTISIADYFETSFLTVGNLHSATVNSQYNTHNETLAATCDNTINTSAGLRGTRGIRF